MLMIQTKAYNLFYFYYYFSNNKGAFVEQR